MLDKDEILEALFDSKGVGNAEWRAQLSRAADGTLQEKALRSHGSIIASWWRHPSSTLTPARLSDGCHHFEVY
jgi:hypothetical protein